MSCWRLASPSIWVPHSNARVSGNDNFTEANSDAHFRLNVIGKRFVVLRILTLEN